MAAGVVDIGIQFSIETRARSDLTNGRSTSAFHDTFGFPENGPVFNLPEGYTANAGDYLVNNRFITQNGPTAVSEPGTWAVLIAGLGLLGLARRRKL